jgi:curved DNA-binding protein CbpA
MKNYYEILGVAPTVTQAEIKERFRFLANAYHPDKFPSIEQKAKAEEEFKEINAAYQVLSVPAKRAEYDRRLGHPIPPNSSHQQRSTPPPQQPPQKSADMYAFGQTIIRTIIFAFLFYLASFMAMRLGIAGVVLFLILLAVIYSKYFWK